MRVIITGGTGLMGRALAKDLSERGYEVVILSRSPQKKADGLPEGVRVLAWDGESAQGWQEAADGAHAIVNLAGENLSRGRWTDKMKQRFRDSRLKAGQAVVQAVEQAQVMPRVVIQSSAVGYYGSHPEERQVTEKAPPGKDYLAKLCQEWENATAAVEQYGVRRAIIRTGVVLDEQSIALRRMAMPIKLFVGGPLGSGRQWLPWVHLTDEVDAIRYLIENARAEGPYNVCAPNTLTNRRFGAILARVLRRPYYFPVPAFLIKLLFGEMSMVVLEGQRAVPKRLQDQGFKFRYPDAESALREIYKK